MLNRVYVLKSEIELVLEMQGKIFHPLCDQEWRYDFAVCTDINQHIELNANLQAPILLGETFGKVTAFERKLRLSNCNCDQTV
jgi:hypothetical protein